MFIPQFTPAAPIRIREPFDSDDYIFELKMAVNIVNIAVRAGEGTNGRKMALSRGRRIITNSEPIPFAADRSFFGHPKGLFFLAFTEAWERFSFYGMTALLVLYMVNQLLLPGHIENIAGFAGWNRHQRSICSKDWRAGCERSRLGRESRQLCGKVSCASRV